MADEDWNPIGPDEFNKKSPNAGFKKRSARLYAFLGRVDGQAASLLRFSMINRLLALSVSIATAFCFLTINPAAASAQMTPKLVRDFDTFKAAAEKGDAVAQVKVGLCYANGFGVSEDKGQAARWYRLAADQGLADAQYLLGSSYTKGTGVPKDDAQAVYWFRKAAEQDHAQAQYFMGYHCAYGVGAPKDYQQAVFWFLKAASQGNADAKYSLGVSYSEGRGIAKDSSKAVYWWRSAAKQGLPSAQFLLGLSYREGVGVKRDEIEAYGWLNLAAVTNENARVERDSLEKGMSPEALVLGQQRSRELQDLVDTLKNSTGR